MYLCLSLHRHRSRQPWASTLRSLTCAWSSPSDFSIHLFRKQPVSLLKINTPGPIENGTSWKSSHNFPVIVDATTNCQCRNLVSLTATWTTISILRLLPSTLMNVANYQWTFDYLTGKGGIFERTHSLDNNFCDTTMSESQANRQRSANLAKL